MLGLMTSRLKHGGLGNSCAALQDAQCRVQDQGVKRILFRPKNCLQKSGLFPVAGPRSQKFWSAGSIRVGQHHKAIDIIPRMPSLIVLWIAP